MNDKLHALILGATGATGKELVKEFIKQSQIFIKFQFLEEEFQILTIKNYLSIKLIFQN